MNRKPKVVYYDDPLNDDFAGTSIKKKPFPKHFKYLHKHNFLFSALSFFLYYFVAFPFLWLVGKIGYGVKVKGKRNTRALFRRGVFYYGNHTQIADGWLTQCFLANPKRTYVMADSDAISIPFVRTLVMMLGCLPIPDMEHKDAFEEAVRCRYAQKRAIAVYPERHIWPYSTNIRPFPDDSFIYPATLGAPVIAFCTTYRKPLLFPNHRKPKMTIHLSRPIYPDMKKSIPERKKQLRDAVYEFMLDYSAEEENEEYIAYLPREKQKPHLKTRDE